MTPEIEFESLISFLDTYLDLPGFPDYPGAMNGLQVEGPRVVRRLAAAVDAAEYTVRAAAEVGADLLVVHHGLFWGDALPLVGRNFRRVAPLVRQGIGVYSAHLPLDAHPEVGNCAELLRALDLNPEPRPGGGAPDAPPRPPERFGQFEGRDIGFMVDVDEPRDELQARAARVLGGPVELIPGGPARVRRLAIVTGSGGSFLADAEAAGVDTLLTGEATHHTSVEARERGVNVLLGGHYRTETWGVKALARAVEDRFGIPWTFLDHPSGL